MLEGLGAAPSTMPFDLRATSFSYASDVRRAEISFTKERPFHVIQNISTCKG